MSRRRAGRLGAGAVLLSLVLLAFEVSTTLISLLSPAVSKQYRAVYIAHSQLCWLSPAERAEAADDPDLAGLPEDADVAKLDHRTLCMLLPDWEPAPHRTPDGGVFSRSKSVNIMLPQQPGQTVALLTVEGYAPPRIAHHVPKLKIEVMPTVDGVAELPATIAVGQTMKLKLGLPPTTTTRIARITLRIPQPGWLEALNDSDDPQYLGLVLRQIDRR